MMTAKTAPKPTTMAQPIHSGNASPITNPSEMTPAAKTVCGFRSIIPIMKILAITGIAQCPFMPTIYYVKKLIKYDLEILKCHKFLLEN